MPPRVQAVIDRVETNVTGLIIFTYSWSPGPIWCAPQNTPDPTL